MHEWSLAEGVILTVLDYQKKNKIKRIREIVLRIGELQQIDKNIFRLALKEMAKTHGMDSKIRIREERAVLKCKACGYTWKFKDVKLDPQKIECIHFVPETVHAYSECPKCRSRDFEILKGRGVWIDSVRGVK